MTVPDGGVQDSEAGVRPPADDAERVLFDVADHVATIVINDPDNFNALSTGVRDGLRAAFARANGDDDVRVVILTGAGEKSFCSGANLKEFNAEAVGPVGRDFVPMPGRNIAFDKPYIAAVNGYAVGGGFLYTQLADLAVAAEHARFSLPEARISRGAPWSVPLIHQVPRKVWSELVMLGEPMSAARAYDVGFVNAVVPLADLMDTARSMAEKIVRAAPLTLAASRRMIEAATEMGTLAAWNVADMLFEPVYASADAIEGPKAFVEKRPPVWQGR